MIEHFVVPINSELWWKGLIFSFFFISTPIILGKLSKPAFKVTLGKVIGVLLIATSFSVQVYMVMNHMWDARSSLPLQLCSISGWLSGIAFFTANQLLFECLLYWGLAGAIHSLFTPEMSLGNHSFIVFEYYVGHAGIILAALYLIIVNGKMVRKHSWFRVFLHTQLVMLAVGAINWLLNSNYMYLCQKPAVDNPFIMGDWPFYLIILEAVALLHFGAIYLGLLWTGRVVSIAQES